MKGIIIALIVICAPALLVLASILLGLIAKIIGTIFTVWIGSWAVIFQAIEPKELKEAIEDVWL